MNCQTKEEFYDWLKENHDKEEECFLECKKGKIKSDSNTLYYVDGVYMALCFGWIDSTHKVIDGKRYQRFSPRKKNSHWSELNKERCRWLIKKGLMTPDGFKILPDLDGEFVIDDDIITALKKDSDVWKNFLDFPDLYKRIKISNIQKERKNEENFKKKLNYFIKNTKSGKTPGNWDDYGRLA